MKKILCVVCLSVLFSISALADGGMGLGGKTCTTNCIVNPETQVEQVKETQTTKTLAETANDYFNKVTAYFIEIAF